MPSGQRQEQQGQMRQPENGGGSLEQGELLGYGIGRVALDKDKIAALAGQWAEVAASEGLTLAGFEPPAARYLSMHAIRLHASRSSVVHLGHAQTINDQLHKRSNLAAQTIGVTVLEVMRGAYPNNQRRFSMDAGLYIEPSELGNDGEDDPLLQEYYLARDLFGPPNAGDRPRGLDVVVARVSLAAGQHFDRQRFRRFAQQCEDGPLPETLELGPLKPIPVLRGGLNP